MRHDAVQDGTRKDQRMIVTRSRGESPPKVCAEKGWGVGTVIRGHEQWPSGEGVWTTLRITALGESLLLARCIRHERTAHDGVVVDDKACDHRESSWTLEHRDWTEVTS